MKTITKTFAALAGLLLLAGCGAAAQNAPNSPQATGPGWRHQQMVEAWEKGDMPAPMMMRGRAGPRGYGPGAMAADGTIDTSKLPQWCPYATAPTDEQDVK